MKRFLIIPLILSSLNAVMINSHELKFESVEDDNYFINLESSFNKQDADKFQTCLLKKTETQNRVLLLCLSKETYQTFGIEMKGNFYKDVSFVPENPYITLRGLQVQTK